MYCTWLGTLLQHVGPEYELIDRNSTGGVLQNVNASVSAAPHEYEVSSESWRVFIALIWSSAHLPFYGGGVA